MVRLGQNFLADPNLLDAIVREAALRPGDVVLEVGAGEGALSRRLAAQAAHLHAIELDRRLEPELADLENLPEVTLHWGDAMRLDLAALEPPPRAMVSNLPYSIATPLIIRTIEELPDLDRWTLMVQREIADRLRSAPGRRLYGGPSVLVQLVCEVRLLRTIDPAVFVPRPRVESALLRLDRRAGLPPGIKDVVRGAFAHRRKALPRSLELSRPGLLEPARAALSDLGLREDSRAEQLTPEQFSELTQALRAHL